MTALPAKRLSARNVGSTIGYTQEALGSVFGTIETIVQEPDRVQITLTGNGGYTLNLEPDDVIDVVLPPLAYFSKEAAAHAALAAAAVGDLAEEMAAYLDGLERLGKEGGEL